MRFENSLLLLLILIITIHGEIYDIHDNINSLKVGVAQEHIHPTCKARAHSESFTPKTRNEGDYDFIIVGGGSAGAVVASRLADSDPSIKVLCLEVGKNVVDDANVLSKSLETLLKAPYCDPNSPDANCPLLSLPIHFSETPFLNGYLSSSNHSHYFQTTPQLYSNKREIYYPRGKLLGGSSATNNMVAFRGHPSDYDQWGKIIKGWSYQDLLPAMKRIETNHQYGSDPAHGTDGPIHLHDSSAFYKFPQLDELLKASWKLGYPKVEDFNKGHDYYGAGYWQQYSNDKGRRTSSYEYFRRLMKAERVCIDGHIAEAVTDEKADLKAPANNDNRAKRKCTDKQNLHIQTESLAIKLIFDDSTKSIIEGADKVKPRVIGVEYVNNSIHGYDSGRKFRGSFNSEEEKSRQGQEYWKPSQRHDVTNCPVNEELAFNNERQNEWYIPPEGKIPESDIKRVYAKREVILSAGAIATPQLLMLSGIGNRKDLEHMLDFKEGEVVMDLPGIGRILDHEEVAVNFKIKNQHWGIVKDFLPETNKWLEGKHSAISSNHVPGGLDISSEGINGKEPTIHIHFIMFYLENIDFTQWRKSDAAHRLPVGMTDFPRYTGLQHYTTLIERCGTCSEGRLTLRNRDPLRTPLIDMNYGSCPFTNQELLFGIKEVRRINAALPKEFQGEEVNPGPEYDTDEKLINWIRNVNWGHHISGTVPMGSCEDRNAALDSHGRVYGVEGLRVADASNFPTIPHGNILYSTYIVAERVAEFIIKDHKLNNKNAPSLLNPHTTVQ